MKLIEKYDAYLEVIHQKQRDYVSKTAIGVPEFLYEVSPKGNINIMTVLPAYYYDVNTFKRAKVTKIDLEKIKLYSENLPEFTPDQIRIPYCYEMFGSKASSAVRYTEMNLRFMSKEDAESLSLEIKAKIANEEILLQNNHSRCYYCHKVYHNSQKVTQKMHSIYTYGREGKWMSFCSGACAMSRQMSLEG